MTASFRIALLGLIVIGIVAACEVDEAAWLSYGGQRYGGAVLPLDLVDADLSPVGPVDASNDPVVAEGQVFALRGVDPGKVLLTPGRSPEDPQYLVWRAWSLGPGNIFTLVPEMCAHAVGTPPEC